MRVIVTRPQREALEWVGQLKARGLDAQALPLIEIAAAADPQPVHQAWARLDGYLAVMFVSANAVDHFFRERPAGLDWAPSGRGPRAWATGPGTLQALTDAGVPPDLIDAPGADAAQFDSEALWKLVRPGVVAGAKVLIVRGSDAQGHSAGRDWLADRLVQVGAEPVLLLAYRRLAPRWSEAQRALAIAAADGSAVWLFSSSEAIANLGRLLPDQAWDRARAVATHPRIAQAATQAGFGVVYPSRPGLAQVVASIESAQ